MELLGCGVSMAALEIIAFDLFGTVFDVSSARREDMHYYAETIKKPEWEPLQFPPEWSRFPAHPDSRDGIARLRSKFTVVAMSNAPVDLAVSLARNSGITFDFIMPLQLRQVYKPQNASYKLITELFKCAPASVLMVTANEKFGDIEAARSLGMSASLIKRTDPVFTIQDLATSLEC